MSHLLLIILGVMVGILIGSVGIGGILIVPFMMYFTTFDIHQITATASFSFIFAGTAGPVAHFKKFAYEPNRLGILLVLLIPCAGLGALVNIMLSKKLILWLLLIFLAVSSYQALKGFSNYRESESKSRLLLFGGLTGFFSSLTGTSGPVILVPLLSLNGEDPKQSVPLSQGVQLPLCLMSSAIFFMKDLINYNVGITLGLSLAGGIFIGAKIMNSLSQQALVRVIFLALVLSLIGVFFRIFT